jgi:hypothetical protein
VPYIPPGWDEWIVPRGMYNYSVAKWFIDNGPGGATQTVDGYQTDTIGALASQFITRTAPSPEPYFLYTSIVAPHVGWPADPGDPIGADPSFFPSPSVKPVDRDVESSARLSSPALNEADVTDKPVQQPLLTSGATSLRTEAHQQRR